MQLHIHTARTRTHLAYYQPLHSPLFNWTHALYKLIKELPSNPYKKMNYTHYQFCDYMFEISITLGFLLF